MDFGVVLIVLALGALALTVAGRYGASCRACRPKAAQRPHDGGAASDSES